MAAMRQPAPSPGEVTSLLQAWGEGDATARDLRRERRGHTLRPTDLVHETYLRLCAQNAAWQNREQLYAVASRLMRRILVDHARGRAAAKRGGGMRVTLDEGLAATAAAEPDLLDLDTALDELTALDERQATLVELRFFG